MPTHLELGSIYAIFDRDMERANHDQIHAAERISELQSGILGFFLRPLRYRQIKEWADTEERTRQRWSAASIYKERFASMALDQGLIDAFFNRLPS